VKALSVAERAALEEALHVDGIDEEIALLRVRLLQAVKKTPEDIDLMFRGAALLSRLVVTKYGLQKGDAGDIQEAIRRAVASLKEIGREDADE